MGQTQTKGRKKSKTREAAELLRGRIERRAYELYELRGKEDGHDLEDWLQAETEASQGVQS